MICDPGEIQRLLNDQLGDVGEPVADLHDRQPAAQVGHRDAEDRRALELSQELHLVLGILGSGAGHPAAKLRGELLARRDRIDQTLVEQLIEQQRKRGDLLRQETGLRAEIDQPRERERVLVEQREVDRPAADPLQHVQHADQRGGLGIPAGDPLQQLRQQRREPATAGRVETPQVSALAELRQAPEHGLDGDDPGVAQQSRVTLVVDIGLEDALELARGAVAGAGPRGAENQRPEMRADAIPVCLQLGRERRPVRGTHRRGEPHPPRLVGRQLVRLLVVPLLQPVLDATQIAVRSVELLDCRGGQQLLAREQR